MTVMLSAQYTRRDAWWTAWKLEQANRGGAYQCDAAEDAYTLWFYDGPDVFVATVWRGAVPPEALQAGYTQAQSDADLADLEGAYLAGANRTMALLTDPDRKQVVAPFPATTAWNAWYCGAGDRADPPGRGLGQRMRFAWTAGEPRGPKTVTLRFNEPVELQDGEAFYSPPAQWSMDDLLDLGAHMPPTDATPNAAGTGNCDVVALPDGSGLLMPAAGTGAYDVDLARAVPVPAAGAGYWESDHGTGAVTPADKPGAGRFHLLTASVRVYFLRGVPLGNPLGVFDVESYRAEWLHPAWEVQMTVDKQSPGAGDLAGWLLLFRAEVT